ncbi:hypothetical protein [Priestia megaterium]|uniref:hypothetical protein n=1 Tax=Priestia megaterium TaxID=1404 RepID=UPI000BFC7BDC|nr:hypothetical protein [Priestia megaterium]PGO60658.1 hypothetical protein CN981_08905 [Priestia megaterium]
MWLVYDGEDELVGFFEDYDEALRVYEKYKKIVKSQVESGESKAEEQIVVLAEVKKKFTLEEE